MDAEIFLPVNSGPNYREFFAMLCNMLPLSPGDSPDVRAARERSAMDAVVALHPEDAFEARLAVRAVAMDAQCADALHAAGLAVDDAPLPRLGRLDGAPIGHRAALVAAHPGHPGEAVGEAAPRRDGTRRLVVPRGRGARAC